MASTSTVKEKRERWKQDYKCRKMGRLHCEYEDDILDRWHAEMEKQRSRSASYLIARREKAKLLPAAPVVKKVPCPSCAKSFPSKKSLSNHKRACSAPARVTPPPDRMTRRSVLNFDESDAEDPAEEVPPVAVDPKEREERWVDPLPAKLQFQQQVNKIAELKCKYSRPNAKVRWYKDRKELFSDGLKYKILIDKQSVTLIINNPDPDDSGKYTCKANEMPTNSLVTVEGIRRQQSPAERAIAGFTAALGGGGNATEPRRSRRIAANPNAPEPPTEVPQERWLEPLPEKLQFQQQESKFAELKCKYSRANAKVRWYKGRKELFSDGSKYEILIDKQSITLIINNPDPDDSGKYTCEANGVPTNSFVTVEEPPIKYVFLTPLPNTMEIYRTKQGVLACKLNSARAPLVWQRDGKPIDVDDPRYQIENDAAGCFTLTIRVVEQIDQGMWTATVNKDVISKCQVSVVEESRDFVETLKSQSANENENVTFECVVNDEDIDVEWFHGDAKIKMDGRHFKEERVGCHRRLLITNLRIEDQGQYKCTTKNDKTMAQLIVDPLKKFECEAGKQKQIKVPFEVKGTRRGDPKPILLRNGKPVDLSKMKDLVEVIINGTVANIVFKNPQKSEAGKWSLKLENTGGVSTEAAFELVVKGKPKTPKGPVDTLDVTSDSCAFLRGANEVSQQLFDEIAAEMALRLANDEHETESSDVDEDEYVVESDDDIPAVEPKEREERWVDPLPAKLQFQQQVNKIAELKCKYSRANAKVHWYKGRKELFSDGLKYKILIDKQSITLIINNPDPDDSGKYSCEANGVPTNSFVTVEDSTDQQPLSSTARRSESRRPKSARKEAAALTPLDAMQCCSSHLTPPHPKKTERTASGSGRRCVGSTAADRPAQAAAAACAAGEEAPDDRDKVPGEPPVTVDGKTKYGAENESREKPRLAKRTKQSALVGRSLRVRGQTSGEPVVLNFDRTRAELELVAPASNCCINVLTPVRPSQRGKYGRSRANTANAGAARAASTSTARTRSRVVAINEAGLSAPPTPSTSQICTTRFLKPQIITAQRKWKVRAGKTLSLGIKFVGTPDPSVCWVKAGGAGTLPPELIMEDHIKGNTSIFFPAAKRSESGAYELRLKNNVGETEGHFEVLVQDRPAPPKGSLAVDNVARDSCTLSWQPPEDDGGSEVTNYVVECRDVGSQVWLPVNNVVGTNSTVPNLQEGHEYQFRVCAWNAFGCSDPLNTDSDVLAMDPYDPPGRPEVTHHDNNQISIKWAPSTDTGGSPIAHYDVQRKDAKTRRWIKVNTHPVYDCAYTDEGVQPEHGYYYRVVAVNEAGLDKPSDQSELAWAKPKFEAPRFELDDINGKEVRVRAGHANTRQYITKSARSNSGQCRIVATNEKGTAETRGLISVVDRPGPPEGPITYPATTNKCQVYAVEDPRDTFVVQLKSKSANENENATFECEVNDEDIDVEWFHGDAKIKVDGRHFKEERVGCHRRLLITNLLIEDQGQYKCTTKDDKTMAQLTVDPLKKFECEAGKEKRIKVPFEVKGTRRGDPKPILLRNGKPVDLNKMKDHVEVIINGTVAEIVFKDPQKSEAGKWSLKLANTGGVSAEAAFELVVKGKPKTPKGPVDTLDVTSDSCIVPGGVRALKRQSILDRNRTSCEEEFDELLLLCDHRAAVSWANLEQSTGSFDNWSKIGEGAFGEVFRIDSIAVKIMPFAIKKEQCSKLVNGVKLKTAKFIFNELFITKQLTELSEDTGSDFVTPSFTQLRIRKIVKGCFPKKLLKAWDAFKKAKPELSENERPDIYADEDLHFVIIGLSYGGKDLEAYTIRNGPECYSIFHQVALSLAIAETVLEFEHRDLHAGNILVEQCAVNEKIRYTYQGKKIDVVSNGVRASIIDFSISRLTKKGVPFFVDLSQDTGLFAQNGVSDGGDYQYDVYRMMKTVASENWSSFWPQTNVYWMGYAAKKLFTTKNYIRAKRKEKMMATQRTQPKHSRRPAMWGGVCAVLNRTRPNQLARVGSNGSRNNTTKGKGVTSEAMGRRHYFEGQRTA
ncbi:hypothetical protein niasHS_001970 [Heterodera schachtii]|uniref:Non-specific serine/threonine protein kinase n=1 Tax=Heterodera schachtii TaxID=97005 RepID=A0ABD2K5R5_HETSC